METIRHSYRGSVSDAKPKKLMDPVTIVPGSKIDLVRKRNVIRRHNEMEKRKPKPKAKMPRADPFAINTNVPASLLPRRYTRGELPCTVEHRSSGLALSWMCPLHNLDYEHYLPIFMDGVRCLDNPHKFIARQGVYEVSRAGRGGTRTLEGENGGGVQISVLRIVVHRSSRTCSLLCSSPCSWLNFLPLKT